MNFVKASVIHDVYESVKYDDQTTGQLNHKGKTGIGYIKPENSKPSWLTTGQLNHKGKTGIGYIKPENSKPSWLTNRIDKDKVKAGPKSPVPNQQRGGSTKDKSVWIKVLSNEEGPLVETEKDKEKNDKEAADKREGDEKVNDSKDTEPLSKFLELTETSLSDEESMSIDDILRQIPEEMMLPSVLTEEPTKIRFGHGIQIKEVNWYKASLPQIPADAKGKEPLVEEIKVK
ncbi:G-type lectin S-receptor-like serine/threonine-protein kinase [Dorcoceras hygrometricum]|uniref:G-type lectin S-receptor-like serine/threonine-protein kinase n=1 Tax=Dorcoceras hygrometricum TaxID=472368 RepID=A0A2Z7AHS4_9LAMI|nr:G-type lectin S-receptor-like serine/threonine-protein kinase [Dorcoceras hygrometricum]